MGPNCLRSFFAIFFSFMICFVAGVPFVFGNPIASDNAALTNRSQVIFNSESGMPMDGANDVLQTGDGYIWIASYGGLIRYDGWKFKNFDLGEVENGLSFPGIRALFEDDGGRLWIGTNDQGIYYYENGAFIKCQSEDPERFYSVRCFAQGPDGTLYAGTSTGLARLTGEGVIEGLKTKELLNQTISSLSFDKNGVLWGISGVGYAFALDGETLLYWFAPGELHEDENHSVMAEGNRIYIGTGGSHLIRLILQDALYNDASYRKDVYDTGNLQTINCMIRSKEGELWLGSETGYGWFNRNMELNSSGIFEQVPFIVNFFQDYEGNLWMASSKEGVVELISGKFQNANIRAGISEQSINAVAEVQGFLYAASDNGLFIMDGDWNPVETALTAQMKGIRIRQLYVDSDGMLWISTYGKGLFRYDPESEEILSIRKEDGLLADQVRCVLELKDGRLAVGSNMGINILQDMQVVESYGQNEGLLNPMILCLLEKEDGTILAGSDGSGIYQISPDGSVDTINQRDGLSSGVILRMRADERNHGIWISAGNSLFFMGDGGVERIESLNASDGSIFDMVVMEDALLMMKRNSIVIVPLEELLADKVTSISKYDAGSGFTRKIIENAWNLYDDGILYLCTTKGIFLLNTDLPYSNLSAPKTAINEIILTLEDLSTVTLENPKEVVIPSDTKRMTICFACLSFDGIPCTLEYYLEGFDDVPVKLSSNDANTVSYTNLSGGNYVFHMSAVNDDGIHSESETLVKIEKSENLFEHPMFWIVAALGIVFSVWALFRMKYQKMKTRQQKYRAITEDALATIANTIDAKDPYTNGHSKRVAEYSREIARRMGLSRMEQERVYYVGLMHDIGKIGIPDAILKKPGRLTDEEFEIMKKHTTIGEEILMNFRAVPNVGQGAASHHERYDGLGYPEGLRGEVIPLVGRIICVADSFDAMATERAYRAPMRREYIIAELKENSGKQFDPAIAQIMIDMIEEGIVLQDKDVYG